MRSRKRTNDTNTQKTMLKHTIKHIGVRKQAHRGTERDNRRGRISWRMKIQVWKDEREGDGSSVKRGPAGETRERQRDRHTAWILMSFWDNKQTEGYKDAVVFREFIVFKHRILVRLKRPTSRIITTGRRPEARINNFWTSMTGITFLV